MVSTLKDSKAPAILSIYPSASAVNKEFKLTVSARDNNEISTLAIEISNDGSTWTEIYKEAAKSRNTDFTVSCNLDVTKYEDGIYKVRAIATDGSGNTNLGAAGTSYVEYNFDRTPPSTPKGLKLTPAQGNIAINWEKGTEKDLFYFKLYRAEAADTQFVLIQDRLSSLNSFDTNVKQDTEYFYRITAVDRALNESSYSEIVSTKLLEDIEKPEILSINPPSNKILPAVPDINILAKDNHKLSATVVEYLDSETGDWVLIGKKDLNNYSEVSSLKWNTTGLKDGIYELRAYSIDTAGNKSEYKTFNYELNLNPPAVPVLKAESAGYSIDLSWTPAEGQWTNAGENDLAGFRIYRKTGDSSYYSLIKETTETSFKDTGCVPGLCYTYKVESIDIYRNTISSTEVACTAKDEDTSSPSAVINSDVKVIAVGSSIQFDGSSSKDNNRIKTYLWEFGDGESSTLLKPTHAYKAAGKYTISLTVEDPAGNKNSSKLEIEILEPKKIGTHELKVYDNVTANAISNANVYIVRPDNTTECLKTDSSGIVKIIGEPGRYKVASYKDKYKPQSKELTISLQTVGKSLLGLQPGEIIIGSLTVKRMTLEEIKSAGINEKEPENQFVYKYNVELEFENKVVQLTQTVNSYGTIYDYKPYKINNETVYPVASTIPSSNGQPPVEAPIITYVTMPGGASWLREFFEVKLAIKNTTQKEFVLDNTKAVLELPQGLTFISSEKSSSTTVDLGKIEGGTSKTLTWVIRGDNKGEYSLKANVNGYLMPFNQKVTTVFNSEKFRVWGSDALELTVTADDYAYEGFYYPISAEIKNVSDMDVCNVNLELQRDPAYYYLENYDIEVSEKKLKPGETMSIEYSLIPTLDGPLTNLETIFTYMQDPDNSLKVKTVKQPAPLCIVPTRLDVYDADEKNESLVAICVDIPNKKPYPAQNVVAELELLDAEGKMVTPAVVSIPSINTNDKGTALWDVKIPYANGKRYTAKIKVKSDNARETYIKVFFTGKKYIPRDSDPGDVPGENPTTDPENDVPDLPGTDPSSESDDDLAKVLKKALLGVYKVGLGIQCPALIIPLLTSKDFSCLLDGLILGTANGFWDSLKSEVTGIIDLVKLTINATTKIAELEGKILGFAILYFKNDKFKEYVDSTINEFVKTAELMWDNREAIIKVVHEKVILGTIAVANEAYESFIKASEEASDMKRDEDGFKSFCVGYAIGNVVGFIAETVLIILVTEGIGLAAKAGYLGKISKYLGWMADSSKLLDVEKLTKLFKTGTVKKMIFEASEDVIGRIKSILLRNSDEIFEYVQSTTVKEGKVICKIKDKSEVVLDVDKDLAGIPNSKVKCLLDGCFTGETLVTTITGLKRIDEISEGNLILAKDVITGLTGYKEVVNVYRKTTKELVHLSTDDSIINTTPSHLFFTSCGLWVSAKRLKAGDKIVTSSGGLKEIISVQFEDTSEPVRIYNLNVADYHTYFVGNSGLLVHNDCTSMMIASGRDAITRARARGITNADELAAIGNAAAKIANVKFNRYKTLVSPQIASNIEYFEEVGYTQVKLFDKNDNLLAIVAKENYDTARVLQNNYLSSRFQSGSANMYLVRFNENLILKQNTDNSLSKLVNTARDAFLRENPTETTRNFAALNYKTPQMTNTTTLKSVSGGNNPVGFVNNPDKERFLTFKANSEGELPLVNQNIPNSYYPRDLDTEYKLLSELDKYIEENLVSLEKGIAKEDILMDVNLHTRYEPCPSCLNVMRQFNERYPNVKINVTWEIPY